MANRFTNQFVASLNKGVTQIFAKVTFAATAAPTLSVAAPFNGKGVVSVTRNSTGTFTFVFGTNGTPVRYDTYVALLGVSVIFDETGNSGTAPLAPALFVKSNAIATANNASIQVVMMNGSLAATDPASTEIGLFQFTFANSNAP